MKKSIAILFLALMLSVAVSPGSAESSIYGIGAEYADLPTAFEGRGPVLQFHQINVGFANAYLIRLGDIAFMVDCGLNDLKTWPILSDYLHRAGVDHLDAFFCSHFHGDHVGNIGPLMAEFGSAETPVYGPGEFLIEEWQPLTNGVYKQLKAGDGLTFGDIQVCCVGPVGKLDDYGWANRDSLNLVICYGSRRFMVTGDFVRGKEVTEQFSGLVSGVDVFQFPHHGLKPYCVDPWVVRILAPRYIVVPATASLDTRRHFSRNFGIDTVWLDAGSEHIVFLTDGERLEVHTFVKPGAYAGI